VAVLSLFGIFTPWAGADEAGDVFGWAERHPTDAPQGRTNMAIAYDGANQEVVLFGGYLGFGASFLGDTWTWNGSEWTERTPANSPPPGSGAMAYDAKIGKVVYFGGGTWTWDGSEWAELAPATTPPSGPFPVMAYDAAREEVVLFVEDSQFEGETWTFDGAEWSHETPAHDPPGRSLAAAAYDAARQQVVLVGGYAGFFLSDTWTWDGTDWTERTPATVPSSEEGPSMAYDAGLGEPILFGGWTGAEPYSDTWSWTGSDWTSRAPVVKPPGRFSAGMAYDEARGQVVLFGGYRPHGFASPSNETWTYQRYGPPSATIAAPAGGRTLTLGQSVATSFQCMDGALAPGIASCQDSNGSDGSAGTLDTTRLGPHTYTVTALSKDGLGATASIGYTVVAPPQPRPAPEAQSQQPTSRSQPPLKLRILYSPNHPHTPNRAGGPRYTFVFRDDAPGATYYCRLDKRAFKPCRSPKVYRNLRPGRHVFGVKSVDPSGLESAVRKVGFRSGKQTPLGNR
jgi:hypothetical protein